MVGCTPDNLFPKPHMIGVFLWGLALFFQTLFVLLSRFKKTVYLPPLWLTFFLFLSVFSLLAMALLDLWSPVVTATQKGVVYLNISWYLALTFNLQALFKEKSEREINSVA